MSAFPRVVDLLSLDGRYGFFIASNNSQPGKASYGDALGYSVAIVGDVNGDGIDDFILGAPRAENADEDPNTDRGEVYLIFGTQDGFPPVLDNANLGSAGVKLQSPTINGGGIFGSIVSALGDVDGDGHDDFMVAEPGYRVAHLYYGGLGGISASVGISVLDVNQEGDKLDRLGGIGDINGDGFDDYYVGGYGGNGYRSFVIFGSASRAAINPADFSDGDIADDRGFRIQLPVYGQYGGQSAVPIMSAGDVNGDGYDDFLYSYPSSPHDENGAESGTGRVYLFYGKADGFADITGGVGTALISASPELGQYFGEVMAGVGDINGDGFDDVALENGQYGRVFVAFGKSGGLGDSVNLGALDGTNGFTIVNFPTDGYGRTHVWITKAGDMNADGIADMAIGTQSGSAFVIFGSNDAWGATLDLATLTEDQGFRVDGFIPNVSYPYTFTAAGGGDVNGDGIDDLVFGRGAFHEGGAAVLYGRADPTAALVLTGDERPNSLWGGDFGDRLSGGDGDDVQYGFDGNDRLDGGAGWDRLEGGAGDDYYIIDATARPHIGGGLFPDIVVERAGEGYDTILAIDSSVDIYESHVERVLIATIGMPSSWSDGLTIRSNSLDNIIDVARSYVDIQDSFGDDIFHLRTDFMSVRGVDGTANYGNDVYYLYGSSIFIYEDDGTDTIHSANSFALDGPYVYGTVENLYLIGTATEGYGNTVANIIGGNELANQLAGRDGDDRLNGLEGDDRLFGENGNDVLLGGAGNDRLDGGSGADRLTGGAGDDVYIVDVAGDRVVEAAGEGYDTVESALAYRLGNHVEALTLTGSAAVSGFGNTLDNTITGNDAANVLDGSSGNDTLIGGGGRDSLNGGLGADALIGGLGDDVYTVDNSLDSITEAADEGYDSVTASVNHTLADHVERLVLTGAARTGTGNALDNAILGSNGADTLRGGDGADTIQAGTGNDLIAGDAGNDILDGGAGRDLMTGGTGADRFVFRPGDTGSTLAAADVITDFSHAQGDRVSVALIDAIAGTPVDDRFAFIGTAAFGGVAGQLRYEVSGNFTYIHGDTNGDTVSDIVIRLNGAMPLVAADFQL